MADISKIKLENEIYNIKDEVARNQLNIINFQGTIMIGDSYGVGTTAGGQTTGWCDRLKELLNLSNNDFYKYVEGGAGFLKYGIDGHTFLGLLQENIDNITDKNSITKIICCGGFNDKDYGSSNLNNAIQGFCSYCKHYFPNAKIYIGMVGNCAENTQNGANIRHNINSEVLRAYQNCIRYGGVYLNGIENILHDYHNFMSSDNIHPSDLGYEFLSAYIFQALQTGFADYVSQPYPMTLKNINDDNGSTFDIITRLSNNAIQFYSNNCDIKFTTPKTIRDDIVLGSFELATFRPQNREIKIPVQYYFNTTDNKFYGGVGFLVFYPDGNILLQCDILMNEGNAFLEVQNVRQINFRKFSYSCLTCEG